MSADKNQVQSNWGPSTLCLHADGHDKPFHCHAMPLCQTSTFSFDTPEAAAAAFQEKTKDFKYSRLGNPTVVAWENIVATLEKAETAVAFSSGMAALTGVFMALVGKDEHVLMSDTLYGYSFHLGLDVMKRFGCQASVVDASNLEAVEKAIQPNTKLMHIESPANPTSKICDIAELAKICHKHGVLLSIDNTFATPYFQKPLTLGADIVIHSVTKYLSGHGDVVSGIACANKQLGKVIYTYRKDTGSIMSPFDAWLCIRGVRTLACRMRQHHFNGIEVAKFLRAHPKIKRVRHPFFDDFPGHDISVKQQKGYGATFAFEMKGGYDAACNLLKHVKMCTVAVSLGNVDTLIEHPASMTHSAVTPDIMAKQGLTPEMIRISVGIEDVEDIIGDLAQALDQI